MNSSSSSRREISS